MLAAISEEKLLASSFATIQHLRGSKMIENSDKLIGEQQELWMIERRRKPDDLVIITEKVDGMNAAVLRQGDLLYPLVRKGYDCRTNNHEWIRSFANFVEANAERFIRLLADGERICGEWMVKTHTLSYKLPHEPFVVFDLISGTTRVRYLDFRSRVSAEGFVTTGLVHLGEAMPARMALDILGTGYHGVIGEPEGIVYRYEDARNGFVCSGKYVSNPLLGDLALFRANELLFNKWKTPKQKHSLT
ncbi:hypothetical protein AGMMS49975_12060 [Clostridia bacterium]|nr:hypothetical protein AGMMS49975_12060 [Clostridia bacterium]